MEGENFQGTGVFAPGQSHINSVTRIPPIKLISHSLLQSHPLTAHYGFYRSSTHDTMSRECDRKIQETPVRLPFAWWLSIGEREWSQPKALRRRAKGEDEPGEGKGRGKR